MQNTANYVERDDQWIEQGCEHCDWTVFADSYPEAIEKRHAHLREEHPKAWLRA